MKNYIFYVPGGGIFSRLFQFAILPLADIDFDNVYLIPAGFAEPDDPNDEFCRKCYDICLNNVNLMNKYGIEDPYEHCFNYVLDQKRDDSYELKGYLSMGPRFDKENKLEDSDKLQLYKKVLDKVKFKKSIYDGASQLKTDLNITERTLGVHVRLTSMNLLHHDLYQQVTIDDYIAAIKKELNTGLYENVFVASDNDESIIKLQQAFGKCIVFNRDYLRYKNEKMTVFDESMIEYEWFYQHRFWVEAFNETLVLANCGSFICRESNLTNMAILLSNGFNKIIRVYHA